MSLKTELVENWNSYLNEIPDEKKDIYFTEEYVKLYETSEKRAFCVVCSDEQYILLLPFLRGIIGDYYDFETAYGYGGPITNCTDETWIQMAISEMCAFLRNNAFVCGLLRFHPLLCNNDLCKYANNIDILYDREVVCIDSSVGPDDIWINQITSKNRNMIRKAEKSGLIFEADYSFCYMDYFKKLYVDTMNRLGADSFYFFDEQYFKQFMNTLGKNSFLGIVKKDQAIVCAAIFMRSESFGHYHLEGSDIAYRSLGANNFLLYGAALEFCNMGVKRFLLGGGNDSMPDNSLLKFKKSFSKNTEKYYIGKAIFNTDAYTRLCYEWECANPEKVQRYNNYLLKYRY